MSGILQSSCYPNKQLFLSRLELLEVITGTRYRIDVVGQAQLPVTDCILRAASRCVLHWMKSLKSLTILVQNRLKDIKAVKHSWVATTRTEPSRLQGQKVFPERSSSAIHCYEMDRLGSVTLRPIGLRGNSSRLTPALQNRCQTVWWFTDNVRSKQKSATE